MSNNTNWWDWIVNAATSLAEIYSTLVENGIITQGEADDYQTQGLTREEIAALVEQRIAATTGWQVYLPWIITAGLGTGLVVALLKKK